MVMAQAREKGPSRPAGMRRRDWHTALRCATRFLLTIAGLLVLTGGQVDAQTPQTRPAGFVDAAQTVPGLAVDLRYFGAANFIGRRVDGYDAPVCILTQAAAEALAAVQRDLAPRGLGLKVFDCYRPARAVAHFLRWAREPEDGRTKQDFYPDLDRRNLFRAGYLAARSGHSRGSTVDLTLVRLPGGQELDMGTPYDFLSPRSGSRAAVPAEVRANRRLLSDAMRKRGFIPYAKEWWHFTLRNEPFPDSYFDFPVR